MPDSHLKELHTALVDAQKGYEEAIRDADDDTVLALFIRARDKHAEAHSDVHATLKSREGGVDGEGSFMGTVHKTVIAVRAAVTGLDDKALGAFADGEERILSAYDKAIADETESSVADTLWRHRGQVADLVSSFKSTERA